MNLIDNIRSFLHLKPKELIVPGNVAATIANCGGSVGGTEQFPEVTDFFARELIRLHPEILGEGKVNCMVAASPDGTVLATHLAHLSGARFASVQLHHGLPKFDRHHLVPKENVVLVLDECRNFISLNDAMALLVHHKVHVTAVACVLNSSGRQEFSFMTRVPILALHHTAVED